MILDPGGPFVEVPNHLAHAWTAGGYTWAELETCHGIPPAVRSRLTRSNAAWAASVVKVYADLEAYAAATGRRECRDGRAWLAPTDRLQAGIRLVTTRFGAGFSMRRRR